MNDNNQEKNILVYFKNIEYAQPSDDEMSSPEALEMYELQLAQVQAANNGHPKTGRLYQAIRTDFEGEPANYLVHLHQNHAINKENKEKDPNCDIIADTLFFIGNKGDDAFYRWEFKDIEKPEDLVDVDFHDDDLELARDFMEEKGDIMEKYKDTPKNMKDMLAKMEREIQRRVEEYEDQQEELRSIIGLFSRLAEAGKTIAKKDIEFLEVIVQLVEYLSSTYGDKYQHADLDTRGILYSEAYGKGYNCGNSFKYLSRYMTEGFEKSNNTKDLMKSIHYLLFEIDRREKLASNDEKSEQDNIKK